MRSGERKPSEHSAHPVGAERDAESLRGGGFHGTSCGILFAESQSVPAGVREGDGLSAADLSESSPHCHGLLDAAPDGSDRCADCASLRLSHALLFQPAVSPCERNDTPEIPIRKGLTRVPCVCSGFSRGFPERKIFFQIFSGAAD